MSSTHGPGTGKPRTTPPRRINDRIRTVGQEFALEQPFLAPLPAEVFDPGLAQG